MTYVETTGGLHPDGRPWLRYSGEANFPHGGPMGPREALLATRGLCPPPAPGMLRRDAKYRLTADGRRLNFSVIDEVPDVH